MKLSAYKILMLATTIGAGERRASFLTWCKGFCLINHERVMTGGWHAITQRVKVRQENCKNLQGLKRLGKCVLGHHYLLLSHCKSHCMLSQTKVGLAFSFTCLYHLFFWIRCLVFSHHAITTFFAVSQRRGTWPFKVSVPQKSEILRAQHLRKSKEGVRSNSGEDRALGPSKCRDGFYGFGWGPSSHASGLWWILL